MSRGLRSSPYTFSALPIIYVVPTGQMLKCPNPKLLAVDVQVQKVRLRLHDNIPFCLQPPFQIFTLWNHIASFSGTAQAVLVCRDSQNPTSFAFSPEMLLCKCRLKLQISFIYSSVPSLISNKTPHISANSTILAECIQLIFLLLSIFTPNNLQYL